jgi:hypothetical protein
MIIVVIGIVPDHVLWDCVPWRGRRLPELQGFSDVLTVVCIEHRKPLLRVI